MTREQFREQQARILDEPFALTSGEAEARRRFEDMALATYDWLAATGKPPAWPYSINPNSGFNFIKQREYAGIFLPPALLGRWESWRDEYPKLLERNPRLELLDIMHAIGETHDASSWPYGKEGQIQDWVDQGEVGAPPFDDRWGIVTKEFYQRLRELRRTCGGWLYCDEVTNCVVFARESEWQRVRMARGLKRPWVRP